MYLNIEIKARSENHERIAELLHHHDAHYIGEDHQIDTYYRVTQGRMKIRRGTIENALVYYKRDNHKGPKSSQVILVENPAPELDEILKQVHGVLVTVDKIRKIYFVDNVKFHLDTVVGLGTFVEIEAIDKDGTIGRKKLRSQCEQYMRCFGIQEKDLIARSYSDLLLQR